MDIQLPKAIAPLVTCLCLTVWTLPGCEMDSDDGDGDATADTATDTMDQDGAEDTGDEDTTTDNDTGSDDADTGSDDVATDTDPADTDDVDPGDASDTGMGDADSGSDATSDADMGDATTGDADAADGDASPTCADSPCQNGGTCTDTESGFTCECTDLFTGTLCDEAAVCEDFDGDEYGAHCFRGADACDDNANAHHDWLREGCVDEDMDGVWVSCDLYTDAKPGPDCDDSNINVGLDGSEEVCNGLSENCAGEIDNVAPNEMCPPPGVDAPHVRDWGCSPPVPGQDGCTILRCDDGFHDTDGSASTGCECEGTAEECAL